MTQPNHPMPARLPFVDALRGFALFGVFGANLMIFSGLTYMSDAQRASLFGTSDRILYLLELWLVENKFIGLFSMLFGISFWLFLERVRTRDRRAIGLFYRRIGWLFLIGAVHGWLLWCFDVLRFYALWAVLLPLFLRVPLKRLLAAALTLAILAPALVAGVRGMMPTGGDGPGFDALALSAFSTGTYVEMLRANWQYDWYLTDSISQVAYQVAVFGRLLLGLYVARAFDLGRLERQRPLLIRIAWTGAIVGLCGSAVFAANLLAESRGFLLPFTRRLIVESGTLALSTAYAAILALGFLHRRWTRAVQSLAPLGRMALTWYLTQTLFGVWLFYGFVPGPHLMAQVGPTRLVLILIVGYAVQVNLARMWLQRFRFGPAEWLWRSLTYWNAQPLVRLTDRAAIASGGGA